MLERVFAYLLLGMGIGFSVLLKLFPQKKTGRALASMFKFGGKKDGGVSSFEAMSAALGGAVGTGNIAGVCVAIITGGPGAMLWMVVSAFFMMSVKYVEVLLAMRYRKKTGSTYCGGPMFYMEKRLGRFGKMLSTVFCILCASAALGIGNAVQSGTAADAVRCVFWGSGETTKTVLSLAVGAIVAGLSYVALSGGGKRICTLAGRLVPLMSLLYVIAGIAVIAVNSERLTGALSLIVRSAISPSAALGGMAGVSMRDCFVCGMQKGVFSNEAGMGSSPMAHSQSSETDFVAQGLMGVAEVFIDTVVICAITGIAVVSSGVPIPYLSPQASGMRLATDAFSTVLGGGAGIFLAAATLLFAFSSIITWAMYGIQSVCNVFGERARRPYMLLFLSVTVAGTVVASDTLWKAAELLNLFMALPNMIALLCLFPEAVRATSSYASFRLRRR